MKFPGLGRRDAAFAVAGTVGLAVGLSLFAEGRLQSEAVLTSRRLEARAPGGDGATTTVQECSPEGDASTATLDLTPTVNTALEFQCSEGSSLHPREKDLQIYRYDTAEKACVTSNAVTLATELEGATLKLKEAQDNSRAVEKKVYVFMYTREPDADKHLCYTCNTPTPSSGKDTRQATGEQAANGTVACTVYIKVPKKRTGENDNNVDIGTHHIVRCARSASCHRGCSRRPSCSDGAYVTNSE